MRGILNEIGSSFSMATRTIRALRKHMPYIYSLKINLVSHPFWHCQCHTYDPEWIGKSILLYTYCMHWHHDGPWYFLRFQQAITLSNADNQLEWKYIACIQSQLAHKNMYIYVVLRMITHSIELQYHQLYTKQYWPMHGSKTKPFYSFLSNNGFELIFEDSLSNRCRLLHFS